MTDRPEFDIAASLGSAAVLVDDVYDFVGRFVAYPSEAAHVAHTLWIAHYWFMDSWESTPRIAFLSPEPGSGKSRALEVTEPLVPRPVHAVNTSPAYLFRKVSDEAGPPTILYDEIDTLFGPKAKDNEGVRGMLNAGHRRGAVAGRCLTRGKIIETEELPAYCAVALAGLDDLPDTIRTRSVIIRMRRRAPNEVVEPWRHRVNGPQAEPIAEQLAAWSNSSARLIRWPDMPAGIEDRNADAWEPLLAIAELAGGEWRERARVAAVALVADMQSERQTLGIQLLADLRMIFEDQPALSTEVILVTLNGIEEAPWGALGRGKNPEDRGLDSRGLATRLRKYKTADGEDIGPRDVRIGDWRGKGYRADDLADAWSRYLPPEPHKSATSATEDELVADVPDVADKSEGGEALFDLCQLCGAELWAPQSQQRGTCERCCRTSQPSEAERPASLPLA